MEITTDLIDAYGESYLICDGRHPIITSCLWDELHLYAIDKDLYPELIKKFSKYCSKDVSMDLPLETLSGGQQIILMLLMAFYSRANKVLICNAMEHLDRIKRSEIQALLSTNQTKEYKFL